MNPSPANVANCLIRIKEYHKLDTYLLDILTSYVYIFNPKCYFINKLILKSIIYQTFLIFLNFDYYFQILLTSNFLNFFIIYICNYFLKYNFIKHSSVVLMLDTNIYRLSTSFHLYLRLSYFHFITASQQNDTVPFQFQY